MIHPFDRKLIAVLPPGAIVDNASWTTTVMDTLGSNYATIDVMIGALDIAMVALKVQESNDNGVADAYADVPGAIFGTSANDTGSTSTLPSATDDNKLFSFHVDTHGRKRYLKLVATGGDGTAGTYLTAIGTLWRQSEGPRTAAQSGLSQRLVV